MRSLIVALLAGALCLSGCEPATTEQLKAEIIALRGELARQADQLRTLEQKVAMRPIALREEAAPAEAKVFSPVRFLADENYLDDPFHGAKDAPVILMMFTDYQCEPCRRFAADTLPRLKETFRDSNALKIVLRDFPLAANTHAVGAATLAHCAGEQGSYWQMHDLLFENRTALDAGDLEAIARQATKVEKKRLTQCLQSKKYNREIEADIASGLKLGAKGAPGFFIGRRIEGDTFDGYFVRGAQPFEVLADTIRHLIAQGKAAPVAAAALESQEASSPLS